jgi:photosystem II stability/assembly factor-like uncharacterized protein
MKTKVFIYLIFLVTSASYSQNRWMKLNGPEGGFIAGLFSKGDTILAGTGLSSGSIFFSTNKGEEWYQSDFRVIQRVADFTYTNDNAFIAACHINGLYKSFDLITWTKLSPQGEFWSTGRDYHGNIYAGTDDGEMYMSTDNGSTWTVTKLSASRIGNFTNLYDLLIAGINGPWIKYPDSGWVRKYLYGYRVATDDVNTIFSHPSSTLYASTDLGESWEKRDIQGFFLYNDCYRMVYNQRLIAAFGDETGWFGDGWGAAVSDDKGWTWRWSQTGLPPFISGYKIIKSGSATYMGTNAAGVFKSTDYGESWFSANNGLTAARVTDLIIDDEGVMYASSWSNGFSKSTDLGKTWRMINNGLTNVYCYSIISDENGILLGGTDQGTFRSTDKGENWTKISGPTFVYHFRKDSKNRICALTFGSGLYRTTDTGSSWERLDKNFVSGVIYAFEEDANGHYYTGGRGGAIYKSTNDGNDWVKVYQGISEAAIIDMVITSEGDIYATSLREGVIRSTDDGMNWELKDNGINTKWVGSLGINSGGDVILGGYSEGIWKSTDKGENWIDITSNMNLITIRKFLLYENELYLATDESVWKSNPDSLTSVTEDDIKPKEYFLSQNYPNPFNPSTTIKYSLAQTGRITLSIYDLLGREVVKLIDEEKPAGEYETKWNASSYPSGVYFIKMQAGEFSETRKVVLVK